MWCVIQTKPACEDLAECALREAGYHVYLPRYRKVLYGHRASGRGVISMRPLFTGYLFAEHYLNQPEHGMVTACGVSRVLRYAAVDGERGKLKLISSRVIEEIREAERAGAFDEARPQGKGKRTDIKPGDAVTLATGPLAGFPAQLVSLDEHGRARLLVAMLGRRTLVGDVDANTLSVAQA